jgi:hypothetical protein
VCQTLRAVNQGQLDVFSRGSAWQQIKILEHESDLAIPDIGEPISIETGDVCAVQNVVACGGPVEATQNIHERGFSGTARAHQRNKFAALNFQRHAAHRGHFHFACAIRFMNIDQPNECAVVHIDLFPDECCSRFALRSAALRCLECARHASHSPRARSRIFLP